MSKAIPLPVLVKTEWEELSRSSFEKLFYMSWWLSIYSALQEKQDRQSAGTHYIKRRDGIRTDTRDEF